MRRDKQAWIGILALVGIVAPFSNSANAITTTTNNNLLSATSLATPADPKSAFLISKPKKVQVLQKYKNAVHLSDSELVSMLKAVGFTGPSLKMAWAVAKKESNGRPLAFNGNANTGDSSYGVFQINMIGALGPDRREKFNLDSNADLFNPVVNAKIAYHMSNGGKNWIAWKGLTPRTKEWLNKFPN